MLEYFYSHFEGPGFFRLFGYVTFRAILAGLSAMIISFVFGEFMIRKLRALNFQEVIRHDGPDSHQSKAGTPTMGGIMILFSLAISCVLFGNFSNNHFVLTLLCTLGLGAVGFWDDYSKVVLKKKNGLNARVKMAATILFALLFCLGYYMLTPEPQGGMREIKLLQGDVVEVPIIQYANTGLFLPFIKGQVLNLSVYLALPFWLCVILGTSHGVNLTDGLDGLAIGTSIVVAATMGVLAYITGTLNWAHYLNVPAVLGSHELTVFLASLTGAGVGFLWFNAPPARIFMGDTGSLAIGGALGMSAVILKKEVLLVIMGGVFVAEALSVILQVGSYRLRGKRIFLMAPLHHHFELKGWPETRVVIRFWLAGVILGLIAISTLRLQ